MRKLLTLWIALAAATPADASKLYISEYTTIVSLSSTYNSQVAQIAPEPGIIPRAGVYPVGAYAGAGA
jgi:hypothetical protein